VARFSAQLRQLPRWLVLNKIDLLAPNERDQALRDIVERYEWRGPAFAVSAVSGQGTDALVRAIVRVLPELRGTDPASAEGFNA
jgi:GTPase